MTRLHASLLATLLLAACSKDSASGAKAEADGGRKAPASGEVELEADPGPKLDADGQPLGYLRASEFVDLRTIVNKSAEQVDAVLGEPIDIGSDRVSCVRFVPERVFFACEQQIRVYAHPQFESIRVEFEDGRAALVALAGLPGDGTLEPGAALASLGVEIPGEPNHDNPGLSAGEPGDVVDRWVWGNSRARLLIDGLEHRVRLSVVNGDWRRAKLEIINNNPLSPAQEQRIKPARGADEPAGE